MSRLFLNDYDGGKESRYHAYLRTGLKFIKQKKIDAAIKEYLKALKLDRKNPIAHNNLGSAFVLLTEYDKAVPHLLKALDICQEGINSKKDDYHPQSITRIRSKPDYIDFSSFFAFLSNFLLIHEESVHKTLFFQSLEEVAIIHNNLGSTYLKLNDYDKAINHFEEALRLDSTNVFACRNLYTIYAHQDVKNKARSYRNKAIKISLQKAAKTMEYSTEATNNGEFAFAIIFCEDAIFQYELILEFENEIKNQLLHSKSLDAILNK